MRGIRGERKKSEKEKKREKLEKEEGVKVGRKKKDRVGKTR